MLESIFVSSPRGESVIVILVCIEGPPTSGAGLSTAGLSEALGPEVVPSWPGPGRGAKTWGAQLKAVLALRASLHLHGPEWGALGFARPPRLAQIFISQVRKQEPGEVSDASMVTERTCFQVGIQTDGSVHS